MEIGCVTRAIATAGVQQCRSVHAKVHAFVQSCDRGQTPSCGVKSPLPAVPGLQACALVFFRGNIGSEIYYCVRAGHPSTAFSPRCCGAERPYSHPQPSLLGMHFHIPETLNTCVRLC